MPISFIVLYTWAYIILPGLCRSPYVQIYFGVTTTNLVEWAIQLASGMDYLASKKVSSNFSYVKYKRFSKAQFAYAQVIHGDLALRNLLLTGTKVLKISDFAVFRGQFKTKIITK